MGFSNNKELAEYLQTPYDTLNNWIKRDSIPLKIIDSMVQNEQFSYDWIFTGKENLTQNSHSENYEIDLLNVRAGAGEGIYNYIIETVDTISLDKSFFRTPINTNKIKGIQVDGDSMEPTLRDGDYVLIDENIRFGTNAIYAIQYGGQILIKRLQFKMDGTVLIISDNPKYEKEVFDPKENQLPFSILGIKILSIQR